LNGAHDGLDFGQKKAKQGERLTLPGSLACTRGCAQVVREKQKTAGSFWKPAADSVTLLEG